MQARVRGDAAIDLTLGYGADSYILSSEPHDPWKRRCFATLVDLAANSAQLHYPHPTRKSTLSTGAGQIPAAIEKFEAAGVIHRISHVSAEDLPLSLPVLDANFAQFVSWLENPINIDTLAEWLRFQLSEYVQRGHGPRMVTLDGRRQRQTGRVLPTVLEYWRSRSVEVSRIARTTGMAPSELRYAFDVVVRGLSYMEVINSTFGESEVSYFSHPVRNLLTISENRSLNNKEQLPDTLSWGRMLIYYLDREILTRDPARIATIVASIRAQAGIEEVTWIDIASRDDDWRPRVLDVASKIDLPPRVRDDVCRKIEAGVGLVGLAPVPGLGGVAGWLVSCAIEVSIVSMMYLWRSHVPSAAGRIKFVRGMLEWPGLINPD